LLELVVERVITAVEVAQVVLLLQLPQVLSWEQVILLVLVLVVLVALMSLATARVLQVTIQLSLG
jgi:hypothetical protein